MHLALCAVTRLVNHGADVVDAYVPVIFMLTPPSYRNWLDNKTGETLAPGLILSLQRAL
jgi:hypothetical protein